MFLCFASYFLSSEGPPFSSAQCRDGIVLYWLFGLDSGISSIRKVVHDAGVRTGTTLSHYIITKTRRMILNTAPCECLL